MSIFSRTEASKGLFFSHVYMILSIPLSCFSSAKLLTQVFTIASLSLKVLSLHLYFLLSSQIPWVTILYYSHQVGKQSIRMWSIELMLQSNFQSVFCKLWHLKVPHSVNILWNMNRTCYLNFCMHSSFFVGRFWRFWIRLGSE